jgi:hypothetical protein
MSVDQPDEFAIGYSTWRLLELTGLGIIMTLLCGAIVFLIPVKGIIQLIVGYAGVAFFGVATCTAVWKLLTRRSLCSLSTAPASATCASPINGLSGRR